MFKSFFYILLLSLSACSDISKKEFKHLDDVQIEARIIKDKSTKNDIKEKFGGAYDLSFNSDGKEKWTYSYQEKTRNPIYSIPLIAVLFGKYAIEHKLEITFEHDIVSSYTLSATHKKISDGIFLKVID